MVVVGSQFGDEGKGKITDILAEKADYVVRFQGGNNAGHTVVVGDNIFKLHLLPSGAIHRKKCLISNGVVLDPRVLVKEIAYFEQKGIEVDLGIDPLTSIILPYHNLLDGISEASLKGNKIGTTGKGIGPAYEDKYGRKGIRFIDLFDKETFRRKLHENIELKRKIVEKAYGHEFSINEEEIFEEYIMLAERLGKYCIDVSKKVHEEISTKKIIFESAQGTFLDISYGTYPFVTASHPITGNVFVDVGFPPQKLEAVGILKAYTTRVGSGPFLTELNEKIGENIRQKGHEFGTTTGRPRRCGWLDLVMLRYAHRLNGFTSLALTKLDVLSGLDKIKVAVKYMMGGIEVEYPLTIEQQEKCKLGYEDFDGFVIRGNEKRYEDLDVNARRYIEFIENFSGVPISIVSIGPDRTQTIFRENVKW